MRHQHQFIEDRQWKSNLEEPRSDPLIDTGGLVTARVFQVEPGKVIGRQQQIDPFPAQVSDRQEPGTARAIQIVLQGSHRFDVVGTRRCHAPVHIRAMIHKGGQALPEPGQYLPVVLGPFYFHRLAALAAGTIKMYTPVIDDEEIN